MSRLMKMMIAGAFSCAAGAGAANAGAASAGARDATAPSVVVRYSSESLATDSGVQDLYRRIVVASRQVCPTDSIRDLAAAARVQACRRQAVSRAIAQVNNSRLAALHATSSKNS